MQIMALMVQHNWHQHRDKALHMHLSSPCMLEEMMGPMNPMQMASPLDLIIMLMLPLRFGNWRHYKGMVPSVLLHIRYNLVMYHSPNSYLFPKEHWHLFEPKKISFLLLVCIFCSLHRHLGKRFAAIFQIGCSNLMFHTPSSYQIPMGHPSELVLEFLNLYNLRPFWGKQLGLLFHINCILEVFRSSNSSCHPKELPSMLVIRLLRGPLLLHLCSLHQH